MIRYKKIFLGNRCNNKCLYCTYRHSDAPQPDFNSIIATLERGEEDSVAFYGGEPTVRSDLSEIILNAKRNGYRRIKLLTNACSFSDIQFLLKIVNAGCYLFEIKLWGSNPSIHDYITQTSGSFLQTIQGLENLQRISFDKFICLRIPICKQNYTDIVNTITVGMSFNINRIILSLQDHDLRLKDLLPYVRNTIDITILNRIWILTEGLPFCVMQGLEHHIGEMYYGYDDTIHHKTYRHHKYCKECTHQEICQGVEVEYLNHFGEKEFPPIKVSKHFQDIRALYGQKESNPHFV